FLVGGLVVEGQAAPAVVDGGGDPGRADVVVGVHGGQDPEGVAGGDGPDPGEGDLAFGHGGQEGVQGVLRCPVEFFDVEELARLHGLDERAGDEVGRRVVLFQDPGGVVVPDELGRGEVGVAFHQHERDAPGGGDPPQDR